MSSSVIVKDQLILDNRLNVSQEYSNIVNIGGIQSNFSQIAADGGSGSFANSILFSNVVTPSMNTTVVSRNMRIQYAVQISYPSNQANEVTPTIALPKPTYDPSYVVGATLRQFPLQSVTDTLQLTINNQTTTQDQRYLISAVARTIPKEYLKAQGTEFPSVSDSRAVLLPDLGTFKGAWMSGAGYAVPGTVVDVTFSNGLVGSFTTGAAFPAAGTYVPVTIAGYPAKAYWIAGPAFKANSTYDVFVDQVVTCCTEMSKYESSYDGASRGSFKPIAFVQNAAPVTAVAPNGWTRFTFLISEPLIISPNTLFDREVYYANINSLSVQFTISQLRDMVVCSGLTAPINLDNLVVEIIQPNPVLQLQYIAVDPKIVSIPQTVVYDYERLQRYPRSVQPMALSGDLIVQTIQSDSLRLQFMPKMIYIFARHQMSSRLNPSGAQVNCRGKVADAFLCLGDVLTGNANISVQLGTRSGLLTTMTRFQAWRMSVKNGLQMTFEDWTTGAGSLLIIDPASDLGLGIDDSKPGEAGSSVNFQIQMQISNANYRYVAETQAARQALGVPAGDVPIELQILCDYQGSCSITPDMCAFSLGDISPKQMETLLDKAPKDGSMQSAERIQSTIAGAGLYSRSKSVLGHGARGRK